LIDKGELNLEQSISTSTGSRSIDDCLDIMITVSDNACGEALGILVGWDTIDELSQQAGFSSTKLNNYVRGVMVTDNVTSPHDAALLLEKLYRGELLSEESTAQFIQYLKDDEINQFLPSGLPAGTVIAHKIGYLYGYVHDAGIIYGKDRDVVVVLMTGEWQTPTVESPPVFAELSSALWEWMN
jgi:beta-lactamase class A